MTMGTTQSKFEASEAGPIPQDWEVKRIGEFLKFFSGKAHEQHISSTGRYVVVNSKFISSDGRVRKYSTKNFLPARAGDVLMVMSDLPNGRALAKCYLVDRNDFYAVNQRVCILRSRNDDPRYLKYVLNRNPYFMAFDDGVQQTHLLNDPIKNCPVVLPKFREQRAIADALGDADFLISTLERSIAKKRAIKQGIMQQLLTGKTRLPGFEGEWRTDTIREIVETPVTDGPHLTPKFLPSGVPFLSVNNLVQGKIDWSDVRYISRSDHREFSRKCAPRRNDILLGKAASVGKVAIVERDVEFNIWSPLAMIRVAKGNSPKFIYFQMQSSLVLSQIELLTNTSSQGNIGMGDIGKLRLPIPPLDEQIAIGDVLSTVDAEVDGLCARLNKARMIRQGMMQELLTGRIRLAPAEVDS